MSNAAAVVLPILTLLVHTTVGMYCISRNLRWAPMIGSYDALVCKRSGQFMMIELKLKSKAGETIAHLYRPGLDGRPTYSHGEENPLEVLNLEVKYSLIII